MLSGRRGKKKKKKNELTTKNQFGIEKSFGCFLLDLFLPSDPAAFFFSSPPLSFFLFRFPRSGATCQAVGFLHASSEETRVLFRASFSLIFVISDEKNRSLSWWAFKKKKEEERKKERKRRSRQHHQFSVILRSPLCSGWMSR